MQKQISIFIEENTPKLIGYYTQAYKSAMNTISKMPNNELQQMVDILKGGDLEQFAQVGFNAKNLQALKTLNAIDVVFNELNYNVKGWLDKNIKESYHMGNVLAIQQMQKAGLVPYMLSYDNQIHNETVKQLAEGTFADILSKNTVMQQGIKNTIKEVIRDSLAPASITGASLGQIKKDMVKKFEDKGIKWIAKQPYVNKAGKTVQQYMSIESYATLIGRTKLNDAAVRGECNRLAENGLDLVQVSDVGECEYCAKFLNNVYSLSGNNKKYKKAVFGIGGNMPPYHPHCVDYTDLYIDKEEETLIKVRQTNKESLLDNIDTAQKPVKNKNNTAFVPAKDHEEAKQYAMNKFNLTTFNTTKMDLNAVNMVNSTMTDLYNKYPVLKESNYIGGISDRGLGLTKNSTWIGGIDGTGTITLNPKYFANFDGYIELQKQQFIDGFKSTASPKHNITHEVGHALHKTISGELEVIKAKDGGDKILKQLTGSTKTNIENVLYDKVHKILKIEDVAGNRNARAKATKSMLSGYATESREEFFAEAFAEYMQSDNPREIAKVFGEELEKILKGINITKVYKRG